MFSLYFLYLIDGILVLVYSVNRPHHHLLKSDVANDLVYLIINTNINIFPKAHIIQIHVATTKRTQFTETFGRISNRKRSETSRWMLQDILACCN